MKKISVIYLLFAILFFFAACSSSKKNTDNDSDILPDESAETADQDINDDESDSAQDSDSGRSDDDSDTAGDGDADDNNPDTASDSDSDTAQDDDSDTDSDDLNPDIDTDPEEHDEDNTEEYEYDICKADNPCSDVEHSTGVCTVVKWDIYSCGCEAGYFWNGSGCIADPCMTDSCSGTAHSTGKCLPRTETAYTCECDENYFWTGSECADPCDPNPCASGANSMEGCSVVADIASYKCECNDNYFWWGAQSGCAAKEPVFGRVCTGLTACYDDEYTDITGMPYCPEEGEDFYGQDAYYARLGFCIPKSFEIRGSGSEKTVFDNNLKLEWQQTAPSGTYSWEDAKNYCKDLEYAGHSDWRVPTPKELLSIVDVTRELPAADPDYFPDVPEAFIAWTSQKYVRDNSDGEKCWRVYFKFGKLNSSDCTQKYNVRCVRGESLPDGHFEKSTVNGDEIVKDTVTGLVWQGTYVASMVWKEALEYCENLEYAGFSDWRLPNRDELISLINYDKADPPSDFPGFPGMYSGQTVLCSSTTSATYASRVWLVEVGEDGRVFEFYKSDLHEVLCVRSE